MKCQICGIKRENRINSKYCEPCAKNKKKTPSHSLEAWQSDMVLNLVGLYKRHEIAKMVCCSRASLQRFAKEKKFSFHIPRYSQETINVVCEYFGKHGIVKTRKKFPDVKIRSIIEKYPHIIRQRRWTDKEILQLLRFGGIVPAKQQAKYFNRPNAHAGSIKSVWSKKLKISSKYINGLPHNYAKHLVRRDCPYVQMHFGSGNWLALWVDMEKHLMPDVEDYIKKLIKTMAKFQNWIHKGDAKKNITKMVKETCNE